MRLGLTCLAVFFPLVSLILSNIMLKWEERGIVGADSAAKNSIRIALIALTVYIFIFTIIGAIACFFLFQYLR